MPRKRQLKTQPETHIIPEYREQLDVHKLCQALILAAKENAKKSDKPCDSASK